MVGGLGLFRFLRVPGTIRRLRRNTLTSPRQRISVDDAIKEINAGWLYSCTPTDEHGVYQIGPAIHPVEGEHVRTNHNNIQWDNLQQLDECSDHRA